MTVSSVPRFLSAAFAAAVHDRQLAEHGGLAGVKDAGLLDSAIARPVQKHSYGEEDLCALGAAYAFGIARNHPFVDGNKRTAWVVARTFLALNDVALSFDKGDAVHTMVALAAGGLDEVGLTVWLRERVGA